MEIINASVDRKRFVNNELSISGEIMAEVKGVNFKITNTMIKNTTIVTKSTIDSTLLIFTALSDPLAFSLTAEPQKFLHLHVHVLC